ncbi:hypothetical protein GGU10DRAFT_354506 [Lentinula aff. detonsa]|uniref:DUF4203 domain-containing protein n=1 Tax=Lentinula aff. detonsa TaxID=2804958 RepID=A0AA38L5L0_9AGAR|nr:hypothetical protein GGU10DRAFT_354506 [Lentinula aff. detonsa]
MSSDSSSSSSSTLSASLPALLPSSSYLIVYALPLLLASLVLTLAGTFLTLDRTRRFRSRDDMDGYGYMVMSGKGQGRMKGMKNLVLSLLEGGVGGLLLGYAFGVHLSTFLALIIPSTTSSGLTSGAFVAIWVLSALFTTILGGRYTLAALLFAGISGGALFSLAVCIIIHPGLSTRIVFVIVGMSVLAIGILLTTFVPPLSKFKHASCRFATSSTGAFGVTMCISILTSSSASWSSPFSHLYVQSSDSWSNSSEKGFSALFSVLLILGTSSDWVLWRKWGECPDEKWDMHLAEYAANLPNIADRAGRFTPARSVWEKVFGREEEGKGDAEMGISLDTDIKYPVDSDLPSKLRKSNSNNPPSFSEDERLPVYKSSPGLLSKKGHRSRPFSSSRPHTGGFRRKDIVKFRPLDELSSSDEDNENDEKIGFNHEKELTRIRAVRRRTEPRSMSPGVSDTENDNGFGPPDYSDFEEDISNANTTISPSTPQTDSHQWSPQFLKRHRSSMSPHSSLSHTSRSSEQTAVPSSSLNLDLPPTQRPVVPVVTASASSPISPIPVPATPSLLTALNRVEKARREAYVRSHSSATATGSPTLSKQSDVQEVKQANVGDVDEDSRSEGRGQRWDEFWREVKDKVGEEKTG